MLQCKSPKFSEPEPCRVHGFGIVKILDLGSNREGWGHIRCLSNLRVTLFRFQVPAKACCELTLSCPKACPQERLMLLHDNCIPQFPIRHVASLRFRKVSCGKSGSLSGHGGNDNPPNQDLIAVILLWIWS